ncbi:MAG: ATP-binding cassette domain-containing protein [Clostridiales bacterium]|nr:ATP-binding cassette domain-containing protein [Clostridiales bacterium]
MIEVRHLTKKYGENTAVNDLSITLETGNIYGFLGPNGAGKTTTMNIITGYIGATSGEVIINGYDINKEPEKAKQCIGYLPEIPPVYGDMRVSEYLNFVADLKQLNRHTRAADISQAMDLTKLHAMKDRLIRNLSKGYRQRVGLAQALMGMPEIIILDEPTVGLDPKQIIEIRDLIKSLKENHTVILSSHIMQEISAVCDHVFIISNGNLVASDTMENLEEQMSGAQQLTVTLRTTEELAGSLESLAGVKAVEILEVKRPGPGSEKVPAADEAGENEESESAEDTEMSELAEDTEVEEASEPAGEYAATAEEPAGEYTPETGETEIIEGNPEVRLEITAKPGRDVREEVFLYCAERNLILLEMTSVTKSLEDVFLELTEAKEVE